MAEILGIIAGVVGLLDIGARASTGLAEIIRNWKDRPILLYALQNDVEDIRVTLDEIQKTTNVLSKNAASASTTASTLNRLLQTAHYSLSELESLVDSFKDLSRIERAVKWTGRQKRAIQIHERLRDVRSRIHELLMAHAVSTVSKIELEILSIRQTNATYHTNTMHQMGAANGTKDAETKDDGRRAHMDGFLSQCALETSTTFLEPEQLSYEVDCSAGNTSLGHAISTTIPATRHVSLPTPTTVGNPSQVATTTAYSRANTEFTSFELRRWATCEDECECSCHFRKNYWSTSPVLQSVVGTLFLGYSGLPILGPRCDSEKCQINKSTSIHVRYMFPTWLFYRTLEVAMRSSTSSFQLNIVVRPRLRWSRSNLFGMIDSRDLDGVKQYIRKNPASVHTVWDRTAQSPLHFAITSKVVDIKIIQLLVQAGSNLDLQNDFGLSAIQHVSLQVFRKLYSPQDEQAIREIIPISLNRGGDYAFSLVHKVVLGICPIDLTALLDSGDPSVPQQLNQRDIFGYTPLHWASSLADLEVVKMLVERGSDVNVKNNMGKTPVLVAASVQNFGKTVEVVRFLIEQKADPLIIPSDGWGPLQWACHFENIELIELLRLHGADLNLQSRRNGTTPLIHAAQSGRTALVAFLIQRGSEIDIQDFEQKTALYYALHGGHHDAVELLLSRGADHTTIDRLGQSLLHCAAERGDIQMMEFLASLHLKDLDVSAKNQREMTAEDIFASRGEDTDHADEENFSRREEVNFGQPVEKTIELEAAFRCLIASVQMGQGGEEEVFFDAKEN